MNRTGPQDEVEGDKKYGKAALGMSSESEGSECEPEPNAKQRKKKGQTSKVPLKQMTVYTHELNGESLQVILLRRPKVGLLMSESQSAALEALVLATREARNFLRQHSQRIYCPGDEEIYIDLDDHTIEKDHDRFEYKHALQAFKVKAKSADGKNLVANTTKFPQLDHGGMRFSRRSWGNAIEGFVRQCRAIWNRLDESDAERYDALELQ